MFNRITKILNFKKVPAPQVIIKKKEALQALKNVNREHRKAFSFFERAQTTHSSIDMLEKKWWNTVGNLIEDVWGMPDDLCFAYRQEYVNRAKKFFLEGKKEAKVLDLGCGTGWFGRIMADENVFYQGIDFSETQISIAQQKAQSSANRNYLSYLHSTQLENIPNIRDFDGVVINAFLHHLCKEELINLFNEIKSTFKQGTKIFIMEPVYPSNKAKKEKDATSKTLYQSILSTIQTIKQQSLQAGIFNQEKENALLNLINESQVNGFFFSPKEVPFKFQEIENLLSQYTHLKKYHYVGVHDFTFLQTLSFIENTEYRKTILDNLFPFIKKLDNQLLEEGYYFNDLDNYIFTCFECELL